MSWRSRPSISVLLGTIPIYGWRHCTALILARPPIFIADIVFLHCSCESPVEVDIERIRGADGDEDEVAQFLLDIDVLLARLRLLEALAMTERARQLAELLRQAGQHRQRREVTFLELAYVSVNVFLNRREAHVALLRCATIDRNALDRKS